MAGCIHGGESPFGEAVKAEAGHPKGRSVSRRDGLAWPARASRYAGGQRGTAISRGHRTCLDMLRRRTNSNRDVAVAEVLSGASGLRQEITCAVSIAFATKLAF